MNSQRSDAMRRSCRKRKRSWSTWPASPGGRRGRTQRYETAEPLSLPSRQQDLPAWVAQSFRGPGRSPARRRRGHQPGRLHRPWSTTRPSAVSATCATNCSDTPSRSWCPNGCVPATSSTCKTLLSRAPGSTDGRHGGGAGRPAQGRQRVPRRDQPQSPWQARTACWSQRRPRH